MRRRPTLERIVITGASSGIGQALARRWAGAGRSLALVARREERLRELASELRREGAEGFVYPCDLTRPGEVHQFVERVETEVGAPDLLVCAAGQLALETADALDPASLEALLAVNLLGTVAVTQGLLPLMARRGGTIVHIASLAALHPFRGLAGYAVSKWALRGYHEALAAELAGGSVALSIVYPSIVDTPMVRNASARAGALPAVYDAWPARDVDLVCRRIARQIEAGRRRIFVSWEDRWLDRLLRIAPQTGPRLIERLTTAKRSGRSKALP